MSNPQITPVIERSSFSFWSDWSAVLNPRRHNWIDFTFISFQIEHSPYKGSSEVTIAILGLHVCFTYVWNEHALDDVRALRDEYLKGEQS